MIVDLDEWVSKGTPPPPRSVPSLQDHTLVDATEVAFPKLPGIATPKSALQVFALDFGPLFASGVITREPPLLGAPYKVMVPQTDADGNDRGGVRLPELAAPLATYTGWNLRDPTIGAPEERVSFIGSYLPFARTAEERAKTGDPRKSIAERYHSRDEYLGLYARAALELVKARFLREEDLASVLLRGQQEWDQAVR